MRRTRYLYREHSNDWRTNGLATGSQVQATTNFDVEGHTLGCWLRPASDAAPVATGSRDHRPRAFAFLHQSSRHAPRFRLGSSSCRLAPIRRVVTVDTR